ncbi:MAG TPA: hypothetical protein VFX64_02180 [Candidatus Nitrosotalea sp.]|nr:hypothetical protein [Candidatus Nitrosotalea sp.]
MSIFLKGERVRIVEPEKKSDHVYIIKSIKRYGRGGTLYLLKLLDENPIMRLYYETDKSLLERIC